MVEWQRETKKKAASSIRLAGKGVSLSLQEVQLLETLIPGNGWSLRAIPVSWQGVKGKCVENKREEFLERERTEKQWLSLEFLHLGESIFWTANIVISPVCGGSAVATSLTSIFSCPWTVHSHLAWLRRDVSMGPPCCCSWVGKCSSPGRRDRPHVRRVPAQDAAPTSGPLSRGQDRLDLVCMCTVYFATGSLFTSDFCRVLVYVLS